MTANVKLNLSLFFLGFLGVLTLLLAPIPPQVPEDVLQQFSEGTFKLLMLINPTILLLIAVLLGASLAKRVGLDAPVIRGFLQGESVGKKFIEQLRSGIPVGLIAGVTITLFYLICKPHLPAEMIALNEENDLNALTRFLYGGITEEILARWGIMSLFIWIGWKIFGTKNKPPAAAIVWVGITLAAILFGMGHLPIIYASISEVSNFLIFYIIVGNMIFGILAGWLFWKKGLEAAMIAHVFGHVMLLLLGQ